MSLLPNLDEMTDNEKMAVLESIQKSISQSKEIQKQKIAANVDLVVQALKKIETDIRSRFDDVGNAIEKRVSTIKDGRDGSNGKDGRDGKDGKNGRDGAKGDRGERGQDGVDGINGVDGVSVTNANIDFDGSLIITLSTGIQINVGEVVASDLVERIKVITNGGGTAQFVLDTLASLQTQITNLIPSQTGNSGKYLTTNGSALSWATIAGSLSYLGTWNASTNTPTLTSSVGTNGIYYIVATAGSTNLNGITDWQIGDWLLFNGSVWQKIDQSDVLQSITSADGSIVVTTTGSTVDLAVSQTSPASVLVEQVRNSTGATLTKGTAVYISGATGQLPTVTKAQANNDTNSAQTLGLITADISNNSNGYVTIIGLVSNLNTSAFTDGAQLYLSPTTAGTLTATKPYAPQHLVYVAVVAHAHPTQGKLLVKVQNGYEMDELHNVSAQSPSNGQTLIYNTTTSLWEKANIIGTASQVTVTNGAGSIALSLPSAINVNTSGSAATLTTPRAIYGNNFDGSAALTQIIASTYGGTGNGFTKFTGATTAEKTYTLPDASSTIVVQGGALGTPSSGTVTNLTGTASININGTVGATTASSGAFTTLSATGVTTVQAGTAALPAITTSGDANTGIFFPAADTIAFSEGGAEAMRIDSSGNVGIGTVSPAGKLDITSGTARMYFSNQSATAFFTAVNTSNSAYAPIAINGSEVILKTGDAERMRIDSSGNLLVGTTSTLGLGGGPLQVSGASNVIQTKCSTIDAAIVSWNATTSGDGKFALFGTEASFTVRGSISYNRAGGLTAYNVTSDYRAKTVKGNVQNALEKIALLKPSTGRMNGAEQDIDFFIAHELQKVVPSAVTGEKDDVNEDGSPNYQMVDKSAIIPLLTAAIQEQQALIQSLTTRITALEAK